MSDQKLVSPLLDGFIMGEPMSSHDGVRCCPAMKENSDDKYIVKIISIPASQKQLDALLLTGAFKDAAAAANYFKELADETVKEARLLQQLSRLEGFLPYEGWQVVPMEDNSLGYEVYLVGTYKRSLEKYLRSNTMTHLGAVNLGLDLCAALSICRRAGYMYVDLKPGNIFLTGDREYRIGDLGFARLKSMKYAALPSKYRSCYTPPELHDEMATLNPTLDIYAVGLILYRIYNNGKLPFDTCAPSTELPAPENADYEMAEIILKACHPNPRHRWQTPIEMGQALANYMQRNSINDVPIVPPTIDVPVTDEEAPEEAAEEAEETETVPIAEFDETAPSEENIDDLPEGEMTEEFNAMFAQADDLLSAEVPDAAFLTAEPAAEEASAQAEESEEEEPVDTFVPDPELEEEDPQLSRLLRSYGSHRYSVDDADNEDEEDEIDEAFRVLRKEDDHASVGVDHRKKGRGWIALIVLLLVLALAGGSGYYYYSNYYLLPIDALDISVAEDTILVTVDTAADEALLNVVCTDTYGNTQTQPLEGGTALFTGLNAGTQYQIYVSAVGFHRTSKTNSGSCATAKQTQVVDFRTKTGAEDGSVILNFTVDGPDVEDWIVTYSAEDEEPQSVSFTGHMVTVTGLTVDKIYNFELIPASSDELWLVGNTTLEYTARKCIIAENVEVVSCSEGVLTIQWSVPEDAAVESWTVRCYDDSGYDETTTVTENSAQFSGITEQSAYTIEVTAADMSQGARAFLTANANTITEFSVTENDNGVNISWTFTGGAPADGWLLMYSVDGGKTSEVLTCSDASGVIRKPIPAATYNITVQTAAGSTVLGGEAEFTCAQAENFDHHTLSIDEIMVSLCQTPDKENWDYRDVSGYTSTYASGSKVSMVVYASDKFYRPNEDFELMFVIRDADGNVCSELVSRETIDWRSIWNNGYAYLDIPGIPAEAGEYSVDLYWYGQYVVTKNLTVTE